MIVRMAQKQQVTVKRASTAQKRVLPPTGPPVVRLTKYSPKVHKTIVNLVKRGNSITDAGLLAGLGKDTIHDWLSKGRHAPERYVEFAALANDILVAQAERRADAVDSIVAVGTSQLPGTWQASAWYLERTDPDNWGRKDKVEHSGNEAPRTQLNTVVLIDSDAREAARDLLKRIAGDSGPDLAIGPGSSVQLEDGDS